MNKSRYDDIHDRFLDPAATKKAGVKYERLAAIVAKCFGPAAIVRHDQRYSGTAEVSTQIDVTLDRGDGARRILLECKDFDVSGDPVEVKVVRDFYAVWKDLGAEEAWIVTCNDFTSPARKWAKAHRIKLAVLREFRESDWEGRVREIHVNLTIASLAGPPRVTFGVGSQDAERELVALFSADAGDMVKSGDVVKVEPEIVYADGTVVGFGKLINDLPLLHQNAGPQHHEFAMSGARLRSPRAGKEVELQKIAMDYNVVRPEQKIVVKAPGIATLLAQGFGEGDMVIWDTTLQRFDIDADSGTVTERSAQIR
jgi:hypothetical protein